MYFKKFSNTLDSVTSQDVLRKYYQHLRQILMTIGHFNSGKTIAILICRRKFSMHLSEKARIFASLPADVPLSCFAPKYNR